MLFDMNGNQQPPCGGGEHFELLRRVMADPDIYPPLCAEVVRIVTAAIAANSTRPDINSRQAGAVVLAAIDSGWHAVYTRRLSRYPNSNPSGVFGMALWHHLASDTNHWRFAGVADPHGEGFGHTHYWGVSGPAGGPVVSPDAASCTAPTRC